MKLYPDFVSDLESDAQMSVDYDDTGTLVVAMDADEVRSLRRLLEFQRELGLPADWLSGDDCRDAEPMLSPRAVGGVRAPQDHRIDNRLLVDALHLAAARRGVRIHAHTEVTEIRFDGGRVCGVSAGSDHFEAGRVIVAAGAWSRQIGGIPEALLPPVRPVRGQMIALLMDQDAPLIRRTIRGRRAYCVPRRDGRLLVGATSEERGFDRQLTAGGIYELLRGVYELLPGSYELPMIDSWAGFRPGSSDNRPILGPTSVEGLLYATGHHRGGILLTPVTAWAMARTVLDGAAPEAIRPFALERFAT
jgi:glycine oxidase